MWRVPRAYSRRFAQGENQPMTIELPLCGECGAAPRSRQELECQFCGAVLPWEIWDDISRERVEVVETEATSLLGAIVAVERSAEFRKAAGPMRRIRRRRLRQMRDRLAMGRSTRPSQDVPPGVILAFGAILLLSALGGAITSISLHAALMITGVLTLVALGLLWLRRRFRPPIKKRKRTKRRRRRSLVPFGVLAVSRPQLFAGMPEGLRRKATLYFVSGNQRVVVTDPDVELIPGQVGYGAIRGLYLDSFHRMHDVPVHPKVEAVPAGAEPRPSAGG